MGKAKDRENTKWALEQNVYGKFLVKFLIIIIKNRDVGKRLLPRIKIFLEKSALNSLFK